MYPIVYEELKGATASKAPELEIMVSELEKSIFQFEDYIKGLDTRLGKVLLPHVDTPQLRVNESDAPHSELYKRLRSMNYRLNESRAQIESMLNRLEL